MRACPSRQCCPSGAGGASRARAWTVGRGRSGGGAHVGARAKALKPVFFFNDTATTEIYTLSLHDALPIFLLRAAALEQICSDIETHPERDWRSEEHTSELQSPYVISYAVFCLKKKTQ